MRIDVIGGGAAGLYSAILLKKSFPAAQISVVERNRPDDTFGFGIVLSDETLGNLREADEPTHREIAASFAYWDDIYVQYKGQVLKSSGHGFSGVRRLSLLQILQRRADELGIEVRYRTEDPGVHAHRGADLVVAADGINSAVREGWKAHFEPGVDLRTNRFVWLGAKMDLPGFYYSFREGPGGIWNMHAYQYTPGESTIVIETTNDAFLASGLGIQDEAATVALVERIFADDLNGARVLANRSFWRQFPTITCRSWRHRDGDTPFVLLGDAAHTAHFTSCPAPGPPTRVQARAKAMATGRMRSNAAGSPPHITVSRPLTAPACPPDTGASTKCRPRLLAVSCNSRATAAEAVVLSTNTASGLMPAKAPCSPSTTERRSSSLPTQANTMSASCAACRGVGAVAPPAPPAYSPAHWSAFAAVRL